MIEKWSLVLAMEAWGRINPAESQRTDHANIQECSRHANRRDELRPLFTRALERVSLCEPVGRELHEQVVLALCEPRLDLARWGQ